MEEYYCKVNESPNRNQSYFPDNAVKGFEAGVYAGRKEVVGWVQKNYLIPSPTDKAGQAEWQAKLKEWGIE